MGAFNVSFSPDQEIRATTILYLYVIKEGSYFHNPVRYGA
jgi:hypothetical protein